ncbi:hypothetical protein PRIPAC_95817 [Pristionchus pacificus]|uniref:Uncharacterized protein n=1 Tax=Pristionchus pacificus TaxID=54126 RepID=A0A2A6BCD0_PRIPA|nr:hypothetical protein PRIPAC_95817 [Pristionchus pacificus]|eukprot:PDM63514.1 hypothetical protein PRIPAC_53871 [Pristionchus pacificus]
MAQFEFSIHESTGLYASPAPPPSPYTVAEVDRDKRELARAKRRMEAIEKAVERKQLQLLYLMREKANQEKKVKRIDGQVKEKLQSIEDEQQHYRTMEMLESHLDPLDHSDTDESFSPPPPQSSSEKTSSKGEDKAKMKIEVITLD